MKRFARLLLVVVAPVLLVAVFSGLLASPIEAHPSTSVCDPDGLQPGGAVYRICMPEGPWNGDLVIFAHGYVAYNRPITIPEDQLQLPGGVSLPDLITGLGYAFATTSYRTNGLAVETSAADLLELVDIFSATHGVPTHTLLTGVSEGGLITALAVEQHPAVFDGGLAACGPIGDFNRQIGYFGDFRVLFDYFFPGLLPGSPVSIPQTLIDNWPAYYTTTIQPVIFDPANAAKLNQLLRVSQAPYVAGITSTIDTSVLDALGYNVLATNDAVSKLGGQPFDNHARIYAGSSDDAQLNQMVQRFTADAAALQDIDLHYQTTGLLTVPLVTLHTTLDQQVPYWHEPLYRAKVILHDSLAFQQHVEVNTYGHCNFSQFDALGAFAKLRNMVISPTARYPSPRVYLSVMAAGSP